MKHVGLSLVLYCLDRYSVLNGLTHEVSAVLKIIDLHSRNEKLTKNIC